MDSEFDQPMLLYLANKLPASQRHDLEQQRNDNAELAAEIAWMNKLHQAIKQDALEPAPLKQTWQQLQQQLHKK